MEDHYDNYAMQAKNVEMTVLFCDMRGFSQIAEKLLPSDVQAMLNRVFTQLSGVILRHGGTIDKYMGDCVMAFWGAPAQTSNHAHQAVLAALSIWWMHLQKLTKYNKDFVSQRTAWYWH